MTMVFHPDPTTVSPLEMQNPIPLSNNILILQIFILLTYTTILITIITLDFSKRTLLVLLNYSNSNILYLLIQITPELPTYPNLPCTTQLPSRK